MSIVQNACPVCSTPYSAGDKFCKNCGASLSPGAILPKKQNSRVRTMGILNIVFSILYLGCTGLALAIAPTLISTARQVLQTDLVIIEAIAGVAVSGLTFLGLLISGILLLKGRASGRTLTQITAAMVIVFVVLDAIFTFGFSNRIAAEALGGACFGAMLRVAYPLTSAIILSPSPYKLGLE